MVLSMMVAGCGEPPRSGQSKTSYEYKMNFIAHSNGKYVCSEGTKMIVNRDKAGEWEDFVVIFRSNEKVNVKTYMGKYVCADLSRGAVLCSDREKAGEWETFTIEKLKNGRIAVKASNNKYVCCDPGAQNLVADRDSVGDWEMFSVVIK